MNLLNSLLLYMTLTFTAAVDTAPMPSVIPQDTVTPIVAVVETVRPEVSPVPTIDITPNPAYKTIQFGDKGSQVRELQEKLIELGYLDDVADGAFGNQTRKAVEAFQYQHGLTADGIAGRRTLTVLYESEEVRSAPDAKATPAPSHQIAVAYTPAPTEAPTPTPTATPTATLVPVTTPTTSDKPVETPIASETLKSEMNLLEGTTVLVGENVLDAAIYSVEDELYLPLVSILRSVGIGVIETSSVEKDELAFAIGSDLVRIAYSEDQTGNPIELEVYKGIEPQVLHKRDIRRVEDVLYFPADMIENVVGITVTVDSNTNQVTLTLPENIAKH